MDRFLRFFTVERSTGLFMMALSVLLLLRPYAVAFEFLHETFNIDLPVSIWTFCMLFCGSCLVIAGRIGRVWYIVLISPLIIDAFSLMLLFGLHFNAGPITFMLAIGFCYLCIYIQAVRDKPIEKRTPIAEPPVQAMSSEPKSKSQSS